MLRTIMILVGGWLLAEFHWIWYLFGAFLILTGVIFAVDTIPAIFFYHP